MFGGISGFHSNDNHDTVIRLRNLINIKNYQNSPKIQELKNKDKEKKKDTYRNKVFITN